MKLHTLAAFVILHSAFVIPSLAQSVPHLINYQSRVAVGGVNFEGTGQFKFALMSGDGSTFYWSNDGTAGQRTKGGGTATEPAAAIPLTVTKGLYSVLLGDSSIPNMIAIPAAVWTHDDVRLRVWFDDGTHGSQLLTPDQRLAPNGYLPDGSVTTAKIANGSVTADKLAAGAVTSAQLADGSVGTSQVASGVTITGTLVGNADTATTAVTATNFTGALAGDVIGSQGATTVQALQGYAVSAAAPGMDSVLQWNGLAWTPAALNLNSTVNFTGALAGDVTGTQSATSISSSVVTGKVLTGFTSGAGTITAADSILTGFNKLAGNLALKAPLASPSFTGTVTLPAGTTTSAPLVLNGGTNLTTPTFGALEFDGTNVFVTNNSTTPTRKTIAFTDSMINSSQIANGTITSAMIAGGAVGSAQLASGLTLGGTTSGSFSGNLSGNATTATSAGSATNFSGTLAGDVTGTQGATTVASVGGMSAANVASGAASANAATDAGTAGTIVMRDASGNFTAGTITAALNGGATTAASFTGLLAGNVTGTQGATVVASVGGVTAANVANSANAANAATNANTASTIVKRDGNGNFTAGTITANLTGTASYATSAGSANSAVFASSASSASNASFATTAGGVSNASSGNIANAYVVRDSSGNFSANSITAFLNGTAAFANSASSANTASFATSAGSANYASYAGGFSGNFVIDSSTQLSDRIKLTGQEYYQPGNTSSDGIAFRLLVNRNNLRGVAFADSAAPVGTSAACVRIVLGTNAGYPNNVPEIGAISTDGSTYKDLCMQIGTGKLGIGAIPTHAKLDVSGAAGSGNSIGQQGYLTNTGAGSSAGPNGDLALSIYATGDVHANVYRAFSDERIKNVLGQSDTAADLATMLRLNVTDYTYKDKIAKGDKPQKKLIAQQVEKVFPQAVSRTKDVVPDIFQKAAIKDGWITLSTNLKKGERVRLIAEKSEGIHEVLEVDANGKRFRTDFKPEGSEVFVYGREVKDFRVVDYEAIAMLNVSATQQIKKEKDAEVKSLREENAALKKQLAEQRAAIALQSTESKTLEARLAALERALDHATPVKVALKK